MKKLLLFPIIISVVATTTARADNPDLMTLIGASSAGDDYAAIDNNGDDVEGNASTYGLSTSDHNSFVSDYGDAGIVRGHGRCSTRAGDSDTWDNNTYNIISTNFVDSLTDETGQTGAQYCYCQLNSYTASGGSAQILSGPWVFYDDYTEDRCAEYCAEYCATRLLKGSSKYLAFRAAMFNAYVLGASVMTTQTYVDNAINAKQAKITTTGTNKLMTYGASTGAIPGSRDIVSTLGTSTTATTVPETGPIVAGIANKQAIVNGTADYIMTGTGTAESVGEKPVYSSTNNYSSALVEAQTVNTAATTAANSELTCIDNDCLLWQISQSAPTGLALASTNPYLMSLIGASSAATAYAARDNSGRDMYTNASTYNLSASDHNSFAVDYGNSGVVRGHGRCSTRAGDSGTWDNDTYNTISNNFVDSLTDETGQTDAQYCYCQLDSYTASGGTAESLSGPWVFRADSTAGGFCTGYCADNCAHYLTIGFSRALAFRSAVFNAYQ